MITVSSREFRSNQKTYLDQVANGAQLLITRKNEAFKIVKVTADDTIVSKKEFFDKVERSIKEAKNAETISMKAGENLTDFVDRLIAEDKVEYDSKTE